MTMLFPRAALTPFQRDWLRYLDGRRCYQQAEIETFEEAHRLGAEAGWLKGFWSGIAVGALSASIWYAVCFGVVWWILNG